MHLPEGNELKSEWQQVNYDGKMLLEMGPDPATTVQY